MKTRNIHFIFLITTMIFGGACGTDNGVPLVDVDGKLKVGQNGIGCRTFLDNNDPFTAELAIDFYDTNSTDNITSTISVVLSELNDNLSPQFDNLAVYEAQIFFVSRDTQRDKFVLSFSELPTANAIKQKKHNVKIIGTLEITEAIILKNIATTTDAGGDINRSVEGELRLATQVLEFTCNGMEYPSRSHAS